MQDTQHIVTVFTPKGAGERGAKPVSIQQSTFPSSGFHDTTSPLSSRLTADKPCRETKDKREKIRTLRHPLQCILKDMARCKEAKPLFPISWQFLMHQDLDEGRQKAGIKPRANGLTSWHRNADIVVALH